MICPSGRLVLWDRKTGKPYERDYEKSIVVIHDKQKKCEGPLWVRGGIPIDLLMEESMRLETGLPSAAAVYLRTNPSVMEVTG